MSDLPDRLTEIEAELRKLESAHFTYAGTETAATILVDDVRWLVAELRATRERLANYRCPQCEQETIKIIRQDGEILRLEAELAAAHQFIQAARELADEAREHIAVPDRYPLANVEEALAGLDRALAAFDANHPAQTP